VAFRAHTQAQAVRLGLTGWVANHYDGTVRVVAEGSESSLQQLLAWLQYGPPAAHVTQVEVVWGEAHSEFHSFQIRH
jgi:acylphosphatase